MIQGSFQDETGKDRPKNREKKISFLSVRTRPDLENSKINEKKI